jgi:hypothetical protein
MDLQADNIWEDLHNEVVPLHGSATSLSLPSDWVQDGELAFAPDDPIECAANLGNNEATSPSPSYRPAKRYSPYCSGNGLHPVRQLPTVES